MASATKEKTRECRVRALDGLNAALQDFDNSRSRDAFNVDFVQERIRAATAAYGHYVSWHNRFLEFPWEKPAMDVAHEESMAALEKITDAKAQFLALKRASSGVEPSAPRPGIPSQMEAVQVAGGDPDGDAYDPNPESTSGQTHVRDGHRKNPHDGCSSHYSIVPQDNLQDVSVPIAAYNAGVRRLDPPPKHRAFAPQRTDDSVRSKAPPHFDLHAVRVVEVLNRTNADYVDVNIIGDTNATSKHGGLGSEVELGTRPVETNLDTKDGVLLMTADVNICNLYPDNEDNDELNPSSKRRASAPQGTDSGVRSETPPSLDLRAIRVAEVAIRTKADHVGVNIIGDVDPTSRDEGFDNDAKMETRPVEIELDTKEGVLMMTAEVNVHSLNLDDGDNDWMRLARALLDSASQRSFISEHLMHKIGHQHERIGWFCLSTLYDPGGVVMRLKVVTIHLSSLDRNFTMEIECLVVNQPPARHPEVRFDRRDFPYLDRLSLADTKAGEDSPIDILIGANALRHILRSDPIVHPPFRGPSTIST